MAFCAWIFLMQRCGVLILPKNYFIMRMLFLKMTMTAVCGIQKTVNEIQLNRNAGDKR